MPAERELAARLRTELAGWGVRLPPDAPDEAPLISSGALDSLGLFRLLLWVEESVGRPVDPSAVDVAAAWDSVAGIVGFVTAAREAA